MGIYIGIDASLNATAMVALNTDGDVLAEIKGLGYSLPEDSTDWQLAQRTKIISDGILGFINDNKWSAIEGYSFNSQGSRILQIAELGGVIRYRITADNWGHKPFIIPPKTLKKFVTSKGNADKPAMAVGVFKMWQYENPDDNVIDAYSLAQLMRYSDPNLCPHLPPLSVLQIDAMRSVGLHK